MQGGGTAYRLVLKFSTHVINGNHSSLSRKGGHFPLTDSFLQHIRIGGGIPIKRYRRPPFRSTLHSLHLRFLLSGNHWKISTTALVSF